jgi:hypothetical protein
VRIGLTLVLVLGWIKLAMTTEVAVEVLVRRAKARRVKTRRARARRSKARRAKSRRATARLESSSGPPPSSI